jgi:orotidine-5'-phosphate decarboxylase
MANKFVNIIKNRIIDSGSSLCIGMDPHFLGLPEFMQRIVVDKGEHYFLQWFGESMLAAAKSQGVSAVKFQAAFFESFGSKGHHILENLISECNSYGICSILDAKRGDISSTMEAYGKASFEYMNADVLTITPYMGFDVISPLEPYLKNGKGIYVVWMSSNPSGKDIQQIKTQSGHTVAEELFDLIEEKSDALGFRDSVGYVLGATKVSEMSENLFSKVKEKPLLMPGVGAQGASVEDARIANLLNMNIHLIPVSRGISGYGKGYFDEDLGQFAAENYINYIEKQVSKFKSQLAPKDS